MTGDDLVYVGVTEDDWVDLVYVRSTEDDWR